MCEKSMVGQVPQLAGIIDHAVGFASNMIVDGYITMCLLMQGVEPQQIGLGGRGD